jgi:hypothetical protein
MKYIRKYPIIDLIVAVVVVIIMVQPWEEVEAPEEMMVCQERQIALTIVQGACKSSITGVSILLASIAAVIGIRKELASEAKDHLRIAAILCVISLLAGVWNMGTLQQFVKRNVAYEISVGIVLILQIWTFFLAGIRMLFGICKAIN